jgi:hypothetical protein
MVFSSGLDEWRRSLINRLPGTPGTWRQQPQGEEKSWMKKWMKIEEEVKGEQGLAALALGKFEELYEIWGGIWNWGKMLLDNGGV